MSFGKEKMAKILASHSWSVQGFNGTPLYLLCASAKTGWMLKKFIGRDYTHFFYLCPKGRVYMHYDEQDWKLLGRAFYDKTDNFRVFKILEKENKQNFLKSLRTAKKYLNKSSLAAMSFDDLIAYTLKCCDILTQSVGLGHIIEAISYISEKKLTEILERKNAVSPENSSLLTAPVYPSFLATIQKTLWQVKIASKLKRLSLINRFLKDYGWFENSYVEARCLNVKEIWRKAAEIKIQPKNGTAQKNKRKKETLMRQLRFSRNDRYIIKLIEETSRWHDDRKKNILLALDVLEPPVKELARRSRLSPMQLKYITPGEIKRENFQNLKFLAGLKNRAKGSAFYTTPKMTEVFIGSEYHYLNKTDQTLQAKQATEIRGLIANKGLVKGKVRVCQSLSSISKVKIGEILVTSMTRPEFLSAMRKAAAIVTDEGGITSHAAIVSRELGIPCIIGSKNATKILKDNDFVEVDATKGIVRKIRPNK